MFAIGIQPHENRTILSPLSRKEQRSAETPPRPSAGEKNTSPIYVTDVTGKTFQDGNEGPHKRVEDGEFTCPLQVVPPHRNLSDSAEENLSDTSGGRSMTLRVRARAATVPARYRQPAKEESRTKFSASSVRKKIVGQEVGGSSMEEKAPAPEIVGKIHAHKNVDSWRGIWTEAEQLLFEDGCILHGWGNWKIIQEMIPTRDRHQVKSHAQKFGKFHPEGREGLQRAYECQLLLPKTDAFIRTNDWKPKSQTKKKLASCLHSVSSRGMTVTSKSGIMVVSLPETTSKHVKKSNILKSDPPKNHTDSSKGVSPCEVTQVLPNKFPVLSPPTSYENEIYVKSDIMVPKTGDKVPYMLAIPHGKKSAHAQMTKASKGAPPLKEGKMSPTHEANAASPPSLLSPHENNISSTTKEINSPVKDQPRKREPTTILSVEECGQPIKKKKSVHDFGTPCSGSWTNLEHMQFEKGCILLGWGNWKLFESLIPSRNSVQIKSHAQKISKNRPTEKETLLRGHKEHHERQSQIMKREAALTTKESFFPWSTARRLPLSKNRVKEEWSLIEKKQFEDGCVFHGWGNWRDISSHIFTKDISQVSAHAESYNVLDRERLEREHTLHFQDDDDALTFQAEKNKKIHHDLFLQGGKKAESGVLMQSPPKTASNKNDDDYGAAKAILALNCANWDKEKHAKKPARVKERESPKAEGASGFLQGEAKATNEVNESIETSAVVSLKEDQVVAMNSGMSVDTQTYKDGSMPESDEAVGVDLNGGPVMSLKVEAPTVKSGPTRPRGSQPPPHWLATDTWDMCLYNIHRWNNKLTESERNAEYLHYDRLSSSEKECLREKLVNLMDNRPTAHHP